MSKSSQSSATLPVSGKSLMRGNTLELFTNLTITVAKNRHLLYFVLVVEALVIFTLIFVMSKSYHLSISSDKWFDLRPISTDQIKDLENKITDIGSQTIQIKDLPFEFHGKNAAEALAKVLSNLNDAKLINTPDPLTSIALLRSMLPQGTPYRINSGQENETLSKIRKHLQICLRATGHYVGNIDGSASLIDTAILRFQQAFSDVVGTPGLVGKKTLDCIEADLKKSLDNS